MTERPADYKLDQMHQAIRQEREVRAAACWAEIQQVLKKHRCTLDAVPRFVNAAGIFSIVVNARVTAQD